MAANKQETIEIKRKAMGLDWADTPKTDIQHHTTGPYMESSGQEQKRKAEEFHETRTDIEEVGYSCGRDREDGPG